MSELVDLRLDEVAFAEHPAIRVRGKGRRERSLPLLKQTTAALRAWLSVRGIAATPEVFLNARGAPMTRSGFTYVLRKHTIAAAARCPSLEGKTVSPHVLRHTCAMTVLHATRDLRRVSLWLGHSSMQTTEIYTRADASEKLAVLEGRVPPTLRKGRYLRPDRLIEMLHNRDQT